MSFCVGSGAKLLTVYAFPRKRESVFFFYWGGLHVRPFIRRGESISNAEVFSPTPHILGCRLIYCFAEPISKVFAVSKGAFFKKPLLWVSGQSPDYLCLPKKTRKRFLFIRAGYTSAHLYGGENPSHTPKCSPRHPTSLAAAFIYYFAELIRKVFSVSKGHLLSFLKRK